MSKNILILNGSPRSKGNTAMLCDAFHDMEIALYDIDEHRLEESFLLIQKMKSSHNLRS